MTKEIQSLVGKTFTKVFKDECGIELYFISPDKSYMFFHEQDCCEDVYIEDICGDLEDLTDTPILVAEERTSCGNEDDLSSWPTGIPKPEYIESFTWTFYEFKTIKGSVTVRWCGQSNGYYSEGVDFKEMSGKDIKIAKSGTQND